MRITRRELLKQFGTAGIALAATRGDGQPSPGPRENIAEQPNIVFIMADQLAAASIGCYGSGVTSTPTLDKLAAQGVRFSRSYAHYPVCAPNRASIFTGRCVDIHGVIVNNYNLTTDNPLVTQVLRSNGYRTGGFGKFHFTCMWRPLPDDYSAYGFDESVGTEDPRWGAWLDWIEQKHPEHFDTALATCWGIPYRTEYGKDKRNMDAAWQAAVKKHLSPLKEKSEWQAMYASPLPAELHQTTYITDLGLDFIRRHQSTHSDRPFFCFLSYVDPHDPYDPPPPYDAIFAPEDMPPPLPMAVEKYGPAALESSRDQLGFRKVADKPAVLRKMRALYHGSIRHIDDEIGRLIGYLESSGLIENTIVLFTTDHGDMMGDHGFITKGTMHYDKCARVPLIVRGPRFGKGRVCERLTTSLDLFPTFCDWADVKARPPFDGISLAEHCTRANAEDSWDEITVQARQATSIFTRDGWRLSTYDEPGHGQMFNLGDDPDEARDLYRSPRWSRKRQELLERHARAYNRYRRIERYANLPLVDGRRHLVDDRQLPTTPLPW